MTNPFAFIVDLFLKLGFGMIAANEIRGLILAGPVLYGIYESGGTWLAIYMGVCTLGGIALSVIVPWFLARRLKRSQWYARHAKVAAVVAV
ncbi:hypothetical protein [Altererythrobacter aquiaggeris]|uniref:hypothetical protein n=1 Tax=Aestuarierythrobacter aquiaggeris TaxID=1898396 RepID=UPI00301A36FD